MEFEPLDQYQQRRQNLKDIEALGHPAYPRNFAWTHTPKQILEKYAGSTVEQLETSPITVSVPGRIVALRPHAVQSVAPGAVYRLEWSGDEKPTVTQITG